MSLAETVRWWVGAMADPSRPRSGICARTWRRLPATRLDLTGAWLGGRGELRVRRGGPRAQESELRLLAQAGTGVEAALVSAGHAHPRGSARRELCGAASMELVVVGNLLRCVEFCCFLKLVSRIFRDLAIWKSRRASMTSWTHIEPFPRNSFCVFDRLSFAILAAAAGRSGQFVHKLVAVRMPVRTRRQMGPNEARDDATFRSTAPCEPIADLSNSSHSRPTPAHPLASPGPDAGRWLTRRAASDILDMNDCSRTSRPLLSVEEALHSAHSCT